jgi:predicted transcriptional regulator
MKRAGMQRTKLELCEETLRALVGKPLTVDSIAYKCSMDCIALRQRLVFLVKSGLVKEENRRKKTVYALTKRGVAILKTLTTTRRLEKLQALTRTIADASQVIPDLSEYSTEKPT